MFGVGIEGIGPAIVERIAVGRGSRAGKSELRQFEIRGNSRRRSDVSIDRKLEPVLDVSLRNPRRRQRAKAEIVKLVHIFTLALPTEAGDKTNVYRITPCFVIQVAKNSGHEVCIGVQGIADGNVPGAMR